MAISWTLEFHTGCATFATIYSNVSHKIIRLIDLIWDTFARFVVYLLQPMENYVVTRIYFKVI